jgi:hypothetical protein
MAVFLIVLIISMLPFLLGMFAHGVVQTFMLGWGLIP